ncbi:MAG: DUF4410 domain-containing protein [Acetobacteraceae bacterium]|nr:DUF4410 domain-containing protein [Acetobacteraceae bacterium]
MQRLAGAVLLAVLLTATVGGCSTSVTNTGTYVPATASGEASLARPTRVIVAEFAPPSDVQLDQGVGQRLMRHFGASDPAVQQAQAISQAQNAIANTLVQKFDAMGLPAERGDGAAGVGAPTVLIQGQLERIDLGNRTRRLAIGFGAGMSEVRATVQVFYQAPGRAPILLQTYDANANSGRKPGLALGAGSAAAGGSLAPVALSGVSSIAGASGPASQGQNLADRVAANVGDYFAQQGWVAASAVPRPSLR